MLKDRNGLAKLYTTRITGDVPDLPGWCFTETIEQIVLVRKHSCRSHKWRRRRNKTWFKAMQLNKEYEPKVVWIGDRE